MTDNAQRMRFVSEYSIEITDPVALSAFLLDFHSVQEQGRPGIVPSVGVPADLAMALTQIAHDAFTAEGQRAGFRPRAGNYFPRPVRDGVYPEFTLPGSLAEYD